jgi:hypothetical protein
VGFLTSKGKASNPFPMAKFLTTTEENLIERQKSLKQSFFSENIQ